MRFVMIDWNYWHIVLLAEPLSGVNDKSYLGLVDPHVEIVLLVRPH